MLRGGSVVPLTPLEWPCVGRSQRPAGSGFSVLPRRKLKKGNCRLFLRKPARGMSSCHTDDLASRVIVGPRGRGMEKPPARWARCCDAGASAAVRGDAGLCGPGRAQEETGGCRAHRWEDKRRPRTDPASGQTPHARSPRSSALGAARESRGDARGARRGGGGGARRPRPPVPGSGLGAPPGGAGARARGWVRGGGARPGAPRAMARSRWSWLGSCLLVSGEGAAGPGRGPGGWPRGTWARAGAAPRPGVRLRTGRPAGLRQPGGTP